MEYRLLGEIEVRCGARGAASLGPHQQRAVLAILILHAGEVVPADRLIESLWDGAPPPSAAKTLQVYVSRLRKALGDRELIATQDRGYVLRARPAEVDVYAFEALLEDGRRAAHDPERAARVLAQALALWRGPALVEFGFDAFAARPIARLEELRLEALESRIDAELALGRQTALVAELELLAAEHPLRERLTRQRMLALYRCGRQADALRVFRDARATLVAELGIEPSPELRDLHERILRQDAALAAPPTTRTPAEDPRRRRVLAVLAAACGALLLGAVLLARGGAPAAAVEANSVAVIDPARHAVVGEVAVGARPGDIAAGAGAIWVANLDDRSVSRIDPRTMKVTGTLPGGAGVDGLAAGPDGIWTLDHERARATRLDPTFGHRVRSVSLGRRARPLASGPSPLALAGGTLWASTSGSTVRRVDARSGRAEASVAVGNAPAGIAVGAGATWVADALDDTVSRIGPGGETATLPVGRGASGIAVGAGGVWVANTSDDTVTRLDPVTGATRAVIAVGAGPRGIAVGPSGVWVAESRGGSVSRIDPRAGRVVESIAVGGSPEDVTIAGGRVWVSVQAAAAPPAAAATLRIVQTRDFGSTDPAVLAGYGQASAQLAFATCAKLLDYSARVKLEPEVAVALPSVSPDGRTYRFTVRPGFRFAPPSGRAVTAHSFRRALERFLSPALQPAGVTGVVGEMDAIAGVAAYRAGRSARIAGVTSTARTLTVRLRRPAPTLPHWMAMPYLCAVPLQTPIRAGGVDRIPSAGRYYIASHTPRQGLLLRRNPGYGGRRPARLDAISYRFGSAPAEAAALVEAGRADYANDALGQLQTGDAASASIDARLARRYGLRGQVARAGRQRYFVHRTMSSSYLLLNTRRPLFADARLRRAVNFAADRAALARHAQAGFASVPADQYLPPTMPGFRDATIYPLGGPDLARARRLAGGHRRRATMYTCNTVACANVAEVVKANLGAIGIDVAIQRFPYQVMWERETERGARYDIGFFGWLPDYADPSQFIDRSIPGFALDFPGAEPYRRRLAAAAQLTGEERLRAYGRLDVDLSTHAPPNIAFATATARDFFAAGIECQTFHPLYGIDLAALCHRHPTRRADG